MGKYLKPYCNTDHMKIKQFFLEKVDKFLSDHAESTKNLENNEI